ncbi:MAG: hypothetical protein HOE90_17180 [Bacteriovoracaceae bacterium]|jgi:hypothetical protein|nr:hypothetical protein [Bacteriovoracaceae bacterium]
MESFIKNIIKTLTENGFPQKKVSLPTEKMYEVADNKGLSFNKVMEEMKEHHNIDYNVDGERIIFSDPTPAQEAPTGNMSQAEMMAQAQEMMKNMDPEELKKMQEMFTNMSDEEKADIMKKGKDMGII